MYHVYIIHSLKDGSYYTGYTEDLESRLKTHNEGCVGYTVSRRPWKIVWCCSFLERAKALSFEKYLKSGSGFAFARKRLV